MIGYIKGTIKEKSPHSLLVMVGGIGYEINISENTFYQIGELGEEIELSIYTNVREDAIELFGFSEPLDKKLFLALISVSGVGAKSAMQILSKASSVSIIQAIIGEDLSFLTKLPSVGKKTASRLIVELSDKLKKNFDFAIDPINIRGDEVSKPKNSVLDDVADGLKGLGYTDKEITLVIKDLENVDGSMEVLFRLALARLAKG